MVKISSVQKMLDNTLHAAKNATAPTAANPVKAVQRTVAETPTMLSTISSTVKYTTKVNTRRAPMIISGGSV
ncbi:hypothetical protein D3C71_1417860 [compost metagenome]